MDPLVNLGIALALGLMIGSERGWQERRAEEGSRVAGIRTFGLIGLLGGLWALLAQDMGETLLGFAFLGLTMVLVIAYRQGRQEGHDVGITTLIAALITFALGAFTVRGYAAPAAAGAVATTTLLSLKPTLHRWLSNLEAEEFYAALKLLLISVVLLPVLPNQGYGPWGVLNPYHIWWMVVLIAGLSFAGYIAMKAVGTERGILLTGLLGGLASSTATTLTFARLARRIQLGRVLAAGTLVASATMFPRVLVEVAVINPQLLPALAPPLTLMTLTTIGYGLWLWRRHRGQPHTGKLPLHNPLELTSALQFGLLLSAILVLAEALRAWLGDAGIYLLAFISGIGDVDAITLSMARMSTQDLPATVAEHAILIATLTNTLMKGVLVITIAGGEMARSFLPGLVLVLAVGGVFLLI
ncbi:MAG TPA: MgtC/SapB family protein [Chromatiales bacterium]|nr:MgtC/SapB family protein [Chromatiales bacterium]HEX23098.1 MgtC/SapB family protein [Chromatiales bacterium]